MRILAEEILIRTGESVELAGWVASRRDHGKLVFIDLRDRSGLVQLVFAPGNKELEKLAGELRSEWVIKIWGKVQDRPSGTVNPDLATGRLEVLVERAEVLGKADPLPFPIDTAGYEIDEGARLKHRYLDLRRPRLQKNLRMRHKVIKFMRDFLAERGFTEIETPILTKSTPEGARDFVVPSRLHPGKFYALPQSPQQYKQLLMISGFERYFQVTRCFRDEDTRGDRQPEFTQLDLEMSFADEAEIMGLVEELYLSIVKKLYPRKKIKLTADGRFERIDYAEAMAKYQSDKPDLREAKDDPDELAFAFIVNFPMFEWKEEEKRWDAVHHPFTQPRVEGTEDFWRRFKEDPAAIGAKQYDLVLNGYEIGGGSIRINDPGLLEAVFEAMGNKKEGVESKFGHLLEAFKYGVPPHGGIAPGIDRFIMVLENEPNIREVIAFPKTGDGRDLMMNGPDAIDGKQLKDLNLELRK